MTLTQFPYHSEVSKSGYLLFWRQGFDPYSQSAIIRQFLFNVILRLPQLIRTSNHPPLNNSSKSLVLWWPTGISLMGKNEKSLERFVFNGALAEREGIEPSVQETLYAEFLIRCIRPLCHLCCAVRLRWNFISGVYRSEHVSDWHLGDESNSLIFSWLN